MQLNGGMQGHMEGIRCIYMGCNKGGENSDLIELNLKSLDKFKFDLRINFVNIITVVKQEKSRG